MLSRKWTIVSQYVPPPRTIFIEFDVESPHFITDKAWYFSNFMKQIDYISFIDYEQSNISHGSFYFALYRGF